jgi:hypothetical protein
MLQQETELVVRQDIRRGTWAKVVKSYEEAIAVLASPFATIHKVPQYLCTKPCRTELIPFLNQQVANGECFSVREALNVD